MSNSSSERPVRTLPSLNALCAFEAAARHLSFTTAAAELHVTQTAISHQVRTLEADLGIALFRRSPRRVALTTAGQAWADELRVIFQRLREANDRLRAPLPSLRPSVSISIIPSFGSRWLVPRLGRFLEAHPEFDVRISASERLVDFALEPIDIGIRYGEGRYPSLVSAKLADDFLVVVASPTWLARHKVRRPSDLANKVLLHDDHPNAWTLWFAEIGQGPPPGLRFNQLTDSAMLVEATLRGQGIGLARWSLVIDELASGRLATAFDDIAPLPSGRAYYLVAPRENLRQEAVSTFRDWVLMEAEGLRPRTPGRDGSGGFLHGPPTIAPHKPVFASDRE